MCRSDIERERSLVDRSCTVDGSRVSVVGGHAAFSSSGTRPPRSCPPISLSFPPSALPFTDTPRSILSADNASTSLRFRGGGVAVLAIDRSSTKDRYFRQGVNRYRESRLLSSSSSSNLMQHLTFRNIFSSLAALADSLPPPLFPPLSALVLPPYLCIPLVLSLSPSCSSPLPPSLPLILSLSLSCIRTPSPRTPR